MAKAKKTKPVKVKKPMDPETAARLANLAVDAVQEHTSQVANASAAQQRKFLEGQMAEARRRVSEARDAVLKYSREQNVIAGDSVRAGLA